MDYQSYEPCVSLRLDILLWHVPEPAIIVHTVNAILDCACAGLSAIMLTSETERSAAAHVLILH